MYQEYRSDCWSSGNSLTQFYEIVQECEECGGTGKVEKPVCQICELADCDTDCEQIGAVEIITCPTCNGAGKTYDTKGV